MDLLSELRAKNQTSEGQAEGTFDSILEDIVGRHDAASSSRHQRKMRPGQLGDLFDAAIGAVADERSAQTISDDPLAQSALKQVSSQQDAADANNANSEHLQAQPEQPETPLATSAHNNEPVALTNQIDSTNEPNTVLTPESTSPQSNNNVTEEPSATEAPATSEKEHLAAADLSDSDSNIASSEEQPSDDDADVLNFDELGAIFDMDESDAAVIVDAALAGHSISQNTDTDASKEEEPKENEASTPLSAAQLAAIALERQAEKSTPESVDSDVVDEEDLPDLERFAPKIALAPDSRVYDYSARMNAAMGNFDKAKKLLQKANAETPSRRLEYRLELVKAQELLANEKPDEARISLETLVSTHPESDEAATLLTTLKSKNKGILSLFSREES
jgi:tetratricopeptide (TPR) repeat protein